MIVLKEKNLVNNEFLINENESFFFENLNLSQKVIIKVEKGRNVKLSFLALEEIKGDLEIYLDEKCSVETYFADFSRFNIKFNVNVYLKDNSSITFHLASLTEKTSNKNFNVSIYHDGKNSFSLVDNYGVVKDEGKLVFDGVSYIKNGSIKSKTRQNAKIMVFDKGSIGIAKPILKIDENDIEASHGAVVGKINDDHLFYLESRGLSEDQAKILITHGYLKPIMNGFDEKNKTLIENLIEGRA